MLILIGSFYVLLGLTIFYFWQCITDKSPSSLTSTHYKPHVSLLLY